MNMRAMTVVFTSGKFPLPIKALELDTRLQVRSPNPRWTVIDCGIYILAWHNSFA
jgi:hypothetical protein